MGRLTLNVLLSFAQFEREVTGERIRDKIGASKRKGLWVGGMVPLGYEPGQEALHRGGWRNCRSRRQEHGFSWGGRAKAGPTWTARKQRESHRERLLHPCNNQGLPLRASSEFRAWRSRISLTSSYCGG